MTTAVAAPRPRLAEFARGASNFTGTLRLLRLYLRRDRIVLPLWILIFSVTLGSVYVKGTLKVYSTVADRVNFMHTINGSSAQLILYGPVYNPSEGMVGVWKAGVFTSLIAIATMLTVIRHTRAEEETGREELLASTRVGRYASLTAALLMTCGGALLAGLIGAASIKSAGVPGSGALAFGLGMAAAGIVFAAVAAVAAQFSANARIARGISFAVLAAFFVLRAVGDVRAKNGPASVFSWVSPQGWSLQIRPYAGDHWWILLLPAAAAAVLIAIAYGLLARRDLGAGLIADRLGAPVAAPALSGPFGLAWRLQRGTLLAWTLGLGLYGLLFGSIFHEASSEVGDNKAVTDILSRLGGAQALEDALITTAFTLLGLMVAAYSISAALRLNSEETSDRAETVLTGAVGRTRWAASHLLYAFTGPVLALLVSGVLAGVVYGAATDEVARQLPRVLGAALVQLPAVWVFTGVTVLLFGLAPRWAPVAWGVFSAAVALFALGSISGMPQWVLDIDPYSHLPKLPAGSFTATPVVILVVIAAALTAVGLIGFRRRDLR